MRRSSPERRVSSDDKVVRVDRIKWTGHFARPVRNLQRLSDEPKQRELSLLDYLLRRCCELCTHMGRRRAQRRRSTWVLGLRDSLRTRCVSGGLLLCRDASHPPVLPPVGNLLPVTGRWRYRFLSYNQGRSFLWNCPRRARCMRWYPLHASISTRRQTLEIPTR